MLRSRTLKRRTRTACRRLLSPNYDLDPGRAITNQEADTIMREWRLSKGGGAGLPATYLYRRLQDLTLCEAIELLNLIKSGLCPGEWDAYPAADYDRPIHDDDYVTLFGPDDPFVLE